MRHRYSGEQMQCLMCLIRRYFYIIFLRRYIERSLKKRKGSCKICGCCGRTQYILGRHQIVCKYFDKETNICLLWKEKGFDALPYACKIYPFDERDKCQYSESCGYYWE